jgi:hypothetical protein|nr:MAG TPA: hypothetical protein [Caudoviricetes sp.]
MSRALLRAAKRAAKVAARGRKKHLSGGALLDRDGYGGWMRMIEMSEEEKTRIELPMFMWLKQCRAGSIAWNAEDWCCVMAAIADGFVSAGYFDQVKELQREFKAAAKLFEVAYVHYCKTGESLESNYDVVHTALNTLCRIKGKLRRDQQLAVLDYIKANFTHTMRALFDGKPNRWDGTLVKAETK